MDGISGPRVRCLFALTSGLYYWDEKLEHESRIQSLKGLFNNILQYNIVFIFIHLIQLYGFAYYLILLSALRSSKGFYFNSRWDV